MKRKTFTEPFWTMLMMGIFSVISNYISATIILKMQLSYLKPMVVLFLLLWPMLLLAEAIVYWIIRKKNVYRKYTWAHILFTFIGLVIVPVMGKLTNSLLSRSITRTRMIHATRIQNDMEVAFFWASIILGHMFFILVLKKSLAKAPVTGEQPETVNLLDDVLN